MKWLPSAAMIGALMPYCSAADPPKFDPPALARAIDQLVEAPLQADKIIPAPRCDDASFFRRAHLVLTGRLAGPKELRAFLKNTSITKRADLINALIESKPFVDHMVSVERGWMIPEAKTNAEAANAAVGFESWLRSRLEKNTPYNALVKELLTAPLNGQPVLPRGADSTGTSAPENPLAFYLAKEARPENVAASSVRLFLGLQLECAQCHDHPFANWSRDQFWGTAAFFAGIERADGALREVFDRKEMAIPNTTRVVPAAFLNDREPEWRYKQSSRIPFAEWVVANDNPYFARAAVNRFWDHCFGIGLVDPIDNFGPKNPPSHPLLLELLSGQFIAAGYDVKHLLRAICLSETFQRSSTCAAPGHQDVRRFARFPMQALSPEQLFESLAAVIGPRPQAKRGPQPLGPDDGSRIRAEFAETFSISGVRTDSRTTVLQALALMNGVESVDATSINSSKLMQAVKALGADSARIELIYLTVLNRLPRPDEVERVQEYLRIDDQRDRRCADLVWALLNSLEFRTVH